MLERDEESDVEELIETLRVHCAHISSNDPTGDDLRWYASAIVSERTNAVSALKQIGELKSLYKISDLLGEIVEGIDGMHEATRALLETTLPSKPVDCSNDGTLEKMEKALGNEKISRMEMGDFTSLLRATRVNLDALISAQRDKLKTRSDFDLEAVAIYRICLKIWRDELSLANDQCKTASQKARRTEPAKFPQKEYENNQDEFIAEVFNTLNIKSKIATAAKNLSCLGGEEKLSYTHIVSILSKK